jgi:exodeoxyribonuclease VII large subunit
LRAHPSLAELPSFRQGGFYIQDPSTLLAVHELGPLPGETILDFCAAPGGKTTFIAQLMGNRGRIVAHDLSAGRLNGALERNVSLHDRALMRFAARLTPSLMDRPRRLKAERLSDLASRLGLATRRAADQAERRARLPDLAERMAGALERRFSRATERLSGLDKLRQTLDPNRPLELGFARVHHGDGSLARSGAELTQGEAVRLVFAHDSRQALISDVCAPRPSAKLQKGSPKKTAEGSQGSLF